MNGDARMKKTAVIAMAAVAAICVCAAAQQGGRQVYVKPELQNAIRITPQMLAPVGFNSMEQYFSAYVDDPRYGKYKVGYMLLKIEKDQRGNQIITQKTVFNTVAYNVAVDKRMWILSETIAPSGHILKAHFEGNHSGIAKWVIGSNATPDSSVYITKNANFDWNNKKIFISFDDPKAPVRVFPLNENTLPIVGLYIYALKSKWTDPSKTYNLPYFDLTVEKYLEVYIKCAAEKEKGVLKFQTVPGGYGDEEEDTYWVTPPSAGGSNGLFRKIIFDPKVARYTLMVPTTKQEALKPVRPIMD
jgi:hypothetical protein